MSRPSHAHPAPTGPHRLCSASRVRSTSRAASPAHTVPSAFASTVQLGACIGPGVTSSADVRGTRRPSIVAATRYSPVASARTSTLKQPCPSCRTSATSTSDDDPSPSTGIACAVTTGTSTDAASTVAVGMRSGRAPPHSFPYASHALRSAVGAAATHRSTKGEPGTWKPSAVTLRRYCPAACTGPNVSSALRVARGTQISECVITRAAESTRNQTEAHRLTELWVLPSIAGRARVSSLAVPAWHSRSDPVTRHCLAYAAAGSLDRSASWGRGAISVLRLAQQN
eukprot:scaffold104105_cov66-Phaeocystis_antarctica.AAC.1